MKGSFGWDMHEQVNKSLRLLCPILDQAVSALFEDLAQRGLLEDTIVGGGGFMGGKLLGESDGEGRFVKSRPVYPWDLWESVHQLMGIDPADRLPNPDGCVAHVSPATACSYARSGILTEIMA